MCARAAKHAFMTRCGRCARITQSNDNEFMSKTAAARTVFGALYGETKENKEARQRAALDKKVHAAIHVDSDIGAVRNLLAGNGGVPSAERL